MLVILKFFGFEILLLKNWESQRIFVYVCYIYQYLLYYILRFKKNIL